MSTLVPGATASVAVAATSANLGPGFDCLGLALDWRDETSFEVLTSGFAAQVSGEGSGRVPTGRSHLVISSALRGLARLGCQVGGLGVACHNTIPHGRGLGSSSAAIVSGLLGASALAGVPVDREWLLHEATEIEGHPDNVAAAVYGGLTLAYATNGTTRAAQGRLHPEIGAVVFVPDTPVSTRAARGLLPATVPHADAAATAGRAALLIHALSEEPELLLDATADWLHQSYRRPAMEPSYGLLERLRAAGTAAVISGAGPSVLALGRADEVARLAGETVPGFHGRAVRPGHAAEILEVSARR